MKKNIKNLNELMEVELSVKSKEDGVDIRVKGTKFAIKGALELLVGSLIKKSNLTEDDIREAVENGLKDVEELELKLDEQMEDLIKRLKEIIEEK